MSLTKNESGTTKKAYTKPELLMIGKVGDVTKATNVIGPGDSIFSLLDS